MALSWTDIKDRALRFANEWKDETSEDAKAYSTLLFLSADNEALNQMP